MSECVLGMWAEFRRQGVAFNALWPRTLIETAAIKMIPGVDASTGRKPEIVADAAREILTRDARQCTGNFFIDEDVLAEAGITDLDRYAVVPGTKEFTQDLFLD